MARSEPIPLIVCDMSGTPDTPAERLREYRRLFEERLVARERTESGVRFHFGKDEDTEAWVRDLAAREKACCAFFNFEIDVADDQIIWDVSVIDDPMARSVLDEFYELPNSSREDAESVRSVFSEAGLTFRSES